MKKIFLILFSLVPCLVFAQAGTFKLFQPPDYPVVYFGSTVQTVKSDPILNKALSPAPYDRFFYMWVYNDDSKQKLLAYAYKEFNLDSVKFYRAHDGQPVSSFHFLSFQKVPLSAGSADAKPPYTLYQLTVPPLSPSGKYQYQGFYAMTDDELRIIRNALLAVEKDEQVAHPDYNNIDVILAPLNAKKRARNDGQLISSGYVQVYYHEKIRDQIFNLPTAEQKADVIMNILHQDIATNEYYKQTSPGVVVLTPTTDPLPLFFDVKPLYSVDFTPLTVDARTSFVTTVDAGFIVFGFPPGSYFRGSPYIGLDFYFRPFDPDIPFKYVKLYKRYTKLTLADRLSFNFGITLNSQAKQYYRADLWGSKNIMTGLGFRLNNILKINAGSLMYYKLDPNFLIDNKKIAFTPYFGASIDIRIGTIFKPFSSLFSL